MNQKQAANWDLSRFLQTLAFFKVMPFLGSWQPLESWLQRWFPGPEPQPQTQPLETKPMGVILVAGATGGVGRRVVQRLLQRGDRVRALVRDQERAAQLLGPEVELVTADITQASTLPADLMREVQSVISCIGTRVQPVEGDTPERAKYSQGVQFYAPEIAGDTPEAVEYLGIQNLVHAFQAVPPPTATARKLIFDFQNPPPHLLEIWGALDDVVMGGVSESGLQLVNGQAVFAGNVSTANSGGFASVRTRNLAPVLNLKGYQGLELQVLGEGQRYKFFLRTDDRWDGIGYCYGFDTEPDTWITVQIPFAEMVPVFRARSVPNAPPLDPSQIYSFQLMLSKFEYDGALNPKFSPGPFSLALQSLTAYGGPRLPQWVMVSSAGVTRPGRPDLDLDAEPPAVRLNDQLGGLLTWKLRGEDYVRASGLSYTIIRPCALTEEPGQQPLKFDQGDTLKGRVSREDIAELCIQALAQPQACGVTFEVAAGDMGCAAGDWSCLFRRLQPDPVPQEA